MTRCCSSSSTRPRNCGCGWPSTRSPPPRAELAAGQTRPAFKLLARVARIFEQLNNAWDVLRTMTPSDYTRFRPALGQSSGFQSWQYRLIEFMLGNRNTAMLHPHAHRDDLTARLQAELAQPSLYDVALRLLDATVPLPAEVLSRDVSAPYRASPAVQAAWARVYRDPQAHWELYELAEKLVDFEDYFRRWRFNHVTTVERVIGFKRGTGGTGGRQLPAPDAGGRTVPRTVANLRTDL